MSLVFSIKQTGVPAGAALAGAVLPAFALVAGWRGALIFVAVLGLVVAAVAQAPRASLDGDRNRAAQFNVAALLAPLHIVARSRPLRELAFLAFAYASVQMCLTSFLVLYLHEVLNWSLIKAGLALTAATLGGVVGRIFWGAVADRGVPPRQVLTIIGLIAGVCGSVLALASPAWEIWLLLSVVALFGATAIGWNGVQLAELAREAPIGTAGAITGAAGFVTFAGVVVGPPLFAALAAVSLTGSGRGPGDPAMLLAVGCAPVSVRWRSLLLTVIAGIAGFLLGDVVSRTGLVERSSRAWCSGSPPWCLRR